ncbi:hypothetical protein AK88_05528 [Plasmodium fragile]|uniref:Schizont-infected cell agglutination C-terminal domain-containing protein n=1 Tax=Plasmodium fragile TaxID=5857 RepID=A0A0D9QCQ6_PLAFR|nr:uncharacterized protein AK88_05528 [Plasmodium fragile]KJP84840.1 hypothetical protein AK88_05528 [Plasmodium fragile]
MEKIEHILDAYATSCEDAGWKRRGEAHKGHVYTDHSVGDVMKCKLMVAALFFVTGWGNEMNDDTGASANDKDMKAIMRCMVADVFANILAEIKCKYEWTGIDRAWEIMRGMGKAGGVENPISSGTCTLDAYKDTNIGTGDLQGAVKNWLNTSNKIRDSIKQIEQNPQCKIKWAQYKKSMAQSENDALATTTATVDQRAGAMGNAGIEKEIVNVVKDVFDKMKEEVIHKSKSPPELQGAGKSSAGPELGDPARGRSHLHHQRVQHPVQGHHQRILKTQISVNAGLGMPGATSTTTISIASGAGADDECGQKSKASSEGSVLSEFRQQRQRKKKRNNNFRREEKKRNNNNFRRERERHHGERARERNQTSNESDRHSVPGTARRASTVAKDDNVDSNQAPAAKSLEPSTRTSSDTTILDRMNPQNPEPPSPDSPGSNHPRDYDPHSTGFCFLDSSGAECQDLTKSSATGPYSVFGETEKTVDPPSWTGDSDMFDIDTSKYPLDLSPTKWNRTYNKCNGANCDPHISPGYVPGLDDVANGFVPPIPADGTLSSSGGNQGGKDDGYAVPDLTADVLTATTPILFFLSAVIVALLGYSLCKYFAYLGTKRRRKFRTVRDVPSPPLDEDILQHLQRGEPPPPDYGYTMVRDTQPGKLPADRRAQRPPRVHTRTIIDLHLEVLNDCEATNWENVKDDYWKIVVEEFAHELMRAAHGHSSSLDAPTTNQALSRNTLSANVHPPTDTAVTDACPPHDPDPWRCMETMKFERDRCPPNEEDPDPWSCMQNIQLAMDPSAPNEHDPDPWSCMETKQLAADPCPPNDPDPRSCMETIPLATDTSPPHEEDSDPWSCMEHIQLETDRCPPNKEHPDPWRCMETIRLATDPCAPNEDNPDAWSCMENIQFATDPFPPNEDDPDPWSCMEPIQLPTEPCPPNEDDPDPWKCMETIQLATDTCAPHDPDPWRCMESIQLATHPCPPNEHDPDRWRSMETIELDTDRSPSNEQDPWKCLETIQFDAEQSRSQPVATRDMRAPDHTNWINWIHRNKHILRACTTQTWLLQLTLAWKQYLLAHMVANEHNGHRAFGEAAILPMMKLRLWKEWVAQQHGNISMYGQEARFQHLLNSVEEETVTATGESPGVEKDLEVEKVMAAEDILRVKVVPWSQLQPQPYMKQPLTANICILLLALVIEQCEIESSMQDTELYVDDLLLQCSH